MNDNIYISFVKNNSVEIENLSYMNIIFNFKYKENHGEIALAMDRQCKKT